MHYKQLLIFCCLFFICCSYIQAQSSYIPLGTNSIYLLDRFEIKSGRLAMPMEFNTSTKAYKRSAIANYVDSFDISHTPLSNQDYFNLEYLQNDNFEWSNSETTKGIRPLFKNTLFKHKAAFYDYISPSKDFNIVVNPVIYLQYGYDTRLKEQISLNNRGIEIRGSIKNAVSFYTQFSDEIYHTNSWVRDMYQKDSIIPGAGFLKTDNYRTFNYGIASGYIAFPIGKYIDIQFGTGKNFIGNGFRTFYMSDFSRENLFLRINTHVWRINYTNIFGEILDYTSPNENTLPKRHYYATTHASVNFSKRFNLGLFQTISFQRDSGYSEGGFDPQYLNPIIFYKPIENGLNSPDKAIIGADFKYNFANHFSLYGQFVISEFVMDEVINDIKYDSGWWGNKQAYQLGIKYIDMFNIDNLDLQLEYNNARPYMYTSFSRLNAYVNYNQNMAHPLGANFREFISVLRYQPIDRLSLKFTGIFSYYGNDTNGSNWGKDIRLSYSSREQEYHNETGQGVRTNLYLMDFIATYMITHNVFIDIQLTYRKTTSALSIFESQTLTPNIALRWNIGERRWDF